MAATRTPLDRLNEVVFHQTAASDAGDPDVFGGPCTVYSFDCKNNHSATIYYKVYDLNSATYASKPLIAFQIPASTRRTIYVSSGLKFFKGLTIRCTDAKLFHSSSDGSSPGSDSHVIVVGKEEPNGTGFRIQEIG